MTELTAMAKQAAGNIARCVGIPATKTVTVLCSPSKAFIAKVVMAELEGLDLQVRYVSVTEGDDSAVGLITQTLQHIKGTSGYVVLLDPSFAPTVFAIIGRPDRGISLPMDHVFCDWFIRPAGLIRTYAVDIEEKERFRNWLLAALAGGRSIRVTTPLGTDITLVQRHWNSCWGEVYTPPVEELTNGTIVVDGSVYFGATQEPFRLQIREGRVVNLDQLNRDDVQQQMLWMDLRRDGQASVLAELGIGICVGADRTADVMEAEQARGTCHFGFGHNVPYGGRNVSNFHGDVDVMDPTIEVDGRVICTNGEFISYVPG